MPATPAATAAPAGHPGNDLSRLPERLSPSRAKDYLDCPQLFYQRTILRIPSPSTPATVRGTLAHAVFETIFDAPPEQRTVEHALTLIAPAWARLTNPDAADDLTRPSRALEYRALFPAGSDAETELLTETEQAIRPWFAMERVANFTPAGLLLPDGTAVDGRELHVEAEIGPAVRMHGFIDRLDRWVGASGTVHWNLSDYKTGTRIPGTDKDGRAYPAPTADRIRHEAFFALRVYALLVHDQLHVTPDRLRLVYTATGDRDRGIVTAPVTAETLEATRGELVRLWDDIRASARAGHWPCRNGYRCKDHTPVEDIALPAAS